MHFSKIVAALMPLLASATISDPEPVTDLSQIEVTYSRPTMEQLHAAYPDVIFQDVDGKLEARDKATNETIAASTATYRFGAGTLAMVGYYALGPGSGQVQAFIDACQDASTSKVTCVNKVLTAAAAHILVGGAGLVGGRQFIMYFWHAAANQASETSPVKRDWIGTPSQLARRQSCSTQLSDFGTSVRFSGQYGLKIAGKDFCYQPDAGELGYTQALAANLAGGLQGAPALTTDFTIFKTSTSQVLARYHAELDSVRTDLCPFAISGGDSCTCSGC